MRMWIDQHLRHGLGNFKIKSCPSADAWRKRLFENECRLWDDSWIEDHSHIFRTLYYRDNFKCIQILGPHLPIVGHLKFEPARLPDSGSCGIYSTMNTGDWLWDMQEWLPAGATIVPVICESDKTHLTNHSADQHAWLLYLMIGNIQKISVVHLKSTPGLA